jgi:hypothetical protein
VSLFGDLGNPRDIDATVRLRLSSSLAHIFQRAKGRLDVDAIRFEAALQHIRVRKQDPGVFARYYDLISDLTSNQIAKANFLLDEIIERAAGPASYFEIVPYARQHLGPDYERFPRLLFAEYSQTNPMASPSDSQSAASTRMLKEALEIVSQVDTGIHEEIKALLVRIHLATASKDRSAKRFGGVTSFLVWGASFINIEFYKTRWDAVQFLVHEITHSLLFGLSFDDPLVENVPDESYKSPLRSDLRPMDGIFHATLVCGRLADFNRAWLESGLAKGTDRESSRKAVADNLRFFRDGVAVIDKHGKLSAQARQLVERSCTGLSVFA